MNYLKILLKTHKERKKIRYKKGELSSPLVYGDGLSLTCLLAFFRAK